MVSKIFSWVLGALVGLLYAYQVVAGVGNILGMREASALLDIPISTAGWFWLIFGLVLPIIAFAVSLLVARRSGAWLRVLVLTAGLCAVAAVQLEISHLVPGSMFFMS